MDIKRGRDGGGCGEGGEQDSLDWGKGRVQIKRNKRSSCVCVCVCVCITMQIGFKSVLDYVSFVWVKGDDLPEVLETLQVGVLTCICPIKILYFIVFMLY